MRPATAKLLRRLLALCLGLAILGVLLRTVGWKDLVGVMTAADRRLLVVAVAFFIPQVGVMSWRWRLIGSTARPLGFWESGRMVLAGSALNVVLPSKLGDLCKGFMLADGQSTGLADGLGLAGLDKLMDVLGLAAVLAVAGAIAPKPEAWVLAFWLANAGGLVVLIYLLHLARPVNRLPKQKALAALIRALNAAIRVRRHRSCWMGALGLSLLLWVLHVAQIYVFYHAVGTQAPAAAVWSRVPMGIFIGLLPLTVAGIGTRDGAFFVLMAAWDPKSVILSLGLFCTFRYVVMALLGVPAIISLGSSLTAALQARQRVEPASPEAPR